MKIFITGASGFVGGAIARKLRDSHEVMGMARSDKSAKKVEALGIKTVRCELNSIQAAHLREVDIVIHCAAFVEPWGKREKFWQANVEGTRHMLDAAKNADVKRFIHLGTEAALFYGQNMVDIDEQYPYPKSSPFLYSETKRVAERLVLEANQPGKFETLSIRPRFVWGPGDTTILPNLIELVDNGRFRWIAGGNIRTSSTHIDNLVHGVELALTKGRGGEAYFITDGEVTTFRLLITGMLNAVGKEVPEKNAPGWMVRTGAWTIEAFWKTFNLRKKPPITRFAANIMSRECSIVSDKAEKEMGYQPVISIEQGLEGLTEFYGAMQH